MYITFRSSNIGHNHPKLRLNAGLQFGSKQGLISNSVREKMPRLRRYPGSEICPQKDENWEDS